VVSVPHGFRAAVALGAAALAMAPGSGRAQPIAVEETGTLPGRRATSIGAFAGVVGFSRDVEIGNSYYDDQVPGLGMLIGARAALALAAWGSSRLDGEAEARIAFARTDAGGNREAGGASVLGWRAHALFETLTGEPVHPFLLAGLGAETLVGGTEFMTVPDTDLVGYLGAGARVPLGRRSALRADLRVEVMAGRDGGSAGAVEAQVGYSFRFGGPGPRIGRIVIAARPPPRPVFAHVEPPAPVDPDGDGVAGAADRCPEQAEDVDQTNDEDGCPDLDDDADGRPDADDRCPRQAETANGFADGDGCPDEVPPDLAAWTGELAAVRFEPGSIKLARRSRAVLDQLGAVLQQYPDVKIEIAAHTDDTGKPDRERELSEQQAAYLKWYLVDKGVDEARIQVVGRGASEMKYDHSTRAGRAANWRIELKLISSDAPPAAVPQARAASPDPIWLPAVPRPVWLAPDVRAELPLFGPRPIWLQPPP
jgi:OOP family OmpA-OmpF porin